MRVMAPVSDEWRRNRDPRSREKHITTYYTKYIHTYITHRRFIYSPAGKLWVLHFVADADGDWRGKEQKLSRLAKLKIGRDIADG